MNSPATASAQSPLARAASAFHARFGAAPTIGAVAPGRVNLIGEHTDYTGGFVLPVAIDLVCAAVARPAADPARTVVHAADLGETGSFDARRPLRAGADASIPNVIQPGGWLSYVAGVVAQFQRLDPPCSVPNLDIAIASAVPLGGGLSSSAALEVAVATLLEGAMGLTLDPVQKALACQRAEHEFAGVPCGVMDQLVSVLGRTGHALLIDCRSLGATPVPMPPAGECAVVVIDTNIRHALASGEYAQRRAVCERAARALGVAQLRDATLALLHSRRGALGEEERRCARHVVTENARTLGAAEALGRADLDELGRLLNASHGSLRDDYRVSCVELDAVVDAARRVAGVYGARMTGGGFGGCAVALVRPESVAGVRRAVGEGYRARHGRDCALFVGAAGAGARTVAV